MKVLVIVIFIMYNYYNNINQKQYEEAIRYFKISFSYNSVVYKISDHYNEIGCCYSYTGNNYETAFQYFKSALQYYSTYRQKCTININMGYSCIKMV